MEFITEFARHTWSLIAEMAPYLLFGFAVAGLLHLLVRPAWVRHLLGRPGVGGVVRASLVGVPMPLCSCSVIPVAASLRKSGAGRGATTSFLSSTPQTGIDSILATYALLGGVFTTVRVGVAFVCGIVSGLLVDWFAGERKLSAAAPPETAPDEDCCQSGRSNPEESPATVAGALRYGFLTLPADLASALILGLVLAGLITTLLPPDLFTGALSGGWLAFLIATLISLPLYVCATGSIPMAYALMASGLSPGAALVFLIVGPATNTATVVTVWKLLGRRATLIYIAALVVVSWLAGWLFNAALTTELAEGGHRHAEALQPNLWQHLSGIALVALLLAAYAWSKRRPKSCCADQTNQSKHTRTCCDS